MAATTTESQFGGNGPVDLSDIIAYLIFTKFGKVIPLPAQPAEIVTAEQCMYLVAGFKQEGLEIRIHC